MQFPTSALASLVCAALAAAPAQAQCELQELAPPADTATSASTQFGRSAGLSGDLAVVGALVTLSVPHANAGSAVPDLGALVTHPTPVTPSNPGPAGTLGIAYAYRKLPASGWVLEAALLPSDVDAQDDFGASAAVEAGLVVVGNPGDDDFGPESGSVYVYQDFGSGLSLVAKLHAADAAPNALFGASVAVDAGRILVGAPGASGPGGLQGVGAAYVFQPFGLSGWLEVARISDPLGGPGDAAGTAVAIDGQRALIGAPGHSLPLFQGAVYSAQELSPGIWLATSKITPSNPSPLQGFGASVALDGSLAAVGAPHQSFPCGGCGGAYLYASGGSSWVEVAQLGQGLAAAELATGDAFGTAVALSGEAVAVSAPMHAGATQDSGAVFVFQPALAGYVLTQEVAGCAPAPELFGQALAAHAGTLLAGAPGSAAAADRGAAFFAPLEVIEVSNETIALFFSEPEVGPAPVPGPPTVDPQCSADPLFPQVEIEDRFDDNPLFQGHRYVLKGRIWEMCLIAHPISSDFSYGGYDPSASEYVYTGTPADCTGEVEFELEHHVPHPETLEIGSLATFRWTECVARDASQAALGPFEVGLRVFVPDGSGHARFDLFAEPAGTGAGWAFWCGKLNLSVVEDHLGSDPGATFHLLTPFGHLVTDPALNLVGSQAGIPPRADALGRPSNQTLGFYDDQGRGLYAALGDTTGDRAKNFQFYGCPGDGSENPLIGIVSLSFQDDVSPGAPFAAVPSFLGRFRGDWYDLADLYRDWLEKEAEITAGLVKDRPDVPDFAKRFQMAGVLGTGLASYVGPSLDGPDGDGPPANKKPLDTVPERLEEYMEHYDLDRMVVLQFGTEWAVGGCEGIGEYLPSAALAANAALMQDKEEELVAEGKELKYMLYFLDSMHTTATGGILDWKDLTVLNPGGKEIEYVIHGCPVTLIDPSTPEWQAHMYSVSAGLGVLGVDGIYCDNAFPDLREYDFSTAHGHAPGFGPYLTEGFGGMFEAIQAGGASTSTGLDPDFITYTEFFFEGFIRRSDTYGPQQLWTDWMTADENTVTVPLISTLYHHYTILGPPLAGMFTHPSYGVGTPNHVLNLLADEREKGRRSANLTMAYGWVNGCPVWCPDPAISDPVGQRFAYELYALQLAGKLPVSGGFSFEQLAAVSDFGAALARVRGFPLVEPFLMVGKRLRDFEDFATLPASLSVELASIFNPYAPSGEQLGPEAEDFPPILHGVFEDLDTGYVGIALANYTSAPATATFTFDPADYGFESPVGVYALGPGGETEYLAPFAGPAEVDVALGGEELLFLRVRP